MIHGAVLIVALVAGQSIEGDKVVYTEGGFKAAYPFDPQRPDQIPVKKFQVKMKIVGQDRQTDVYQAADREGGLFLVQIVKLPAGVSPQTLFASVCKQWMGYWHAKIKEQKDVKFDGAPGYSGTATRSLDDPNAPAVRILQHPSNLPPEQFMNWIRMEMHVNKGQVYVVVVEVPYVVAEHEQRSDKFLNSFELIKSAKEPPAKKPRQPACHVLERDGVGLVSLVEMRMLHRETGGRIDLTVIRIFFKPDSTPQNPTKVRYFRRAKSGPTCAHGGRKGHTLLWPAAYHSPLTVPTAGGWGRAERAPQMRCPVDTRSSGQSRDRTGDTWIFRAGLSIVETTRFPDDFAHFITLEIYCKPSH